MFGYFFSLILIPLVLSLQPPIRNVYTFPPNRFIEDIAIMSNSTLLLTSMSVPHLFSISNPSPLLPEPSPTPSIIYTFPNASGLGNIIETTPNTFIVVSAIWDLASTRVLNDSAVVWSVDLRKRDPVIKKVVGVKGTSFNGMANLGNGIVMAADSAVGAVIRIDSITGKYETAFSDPLFAPISDQIGANLGINGLLFRSPYLYFTNSARGIYGRVLLNHRGKKAGEVEVISRNGVDGGNYDDFVIDEKGRTWIATHPSNVVEVKKDGTQVVITNATMLLNPTSCALGRGSEKERRTLYVTNGGRFVGEDLVDERVVALDLSRV